MRRGLLRLRRQRNRRVTSRFLRLRLLRFFFWQKALKGVYPSHRAQGRRRQRLRLLVLQLGTCHRVGNRLGLRPACEKSPKSTCEEANGCCSKDELSFQRHGPSPQGTQRRTLALRLPLSSLKEQVRIKKQSR